MSRLKGLVKARELNLAFGASLLECINGFCDEIE